MGGVDSLTNDVVDILDVGFLLFLHCLGGLPHLLRTRFPIVLFTPIPRAIAAPRVATHAVFFLCGFVGRGRRPPRCQTCTHVAEDRVSHPSQPALLHRNVDFGYRTRTGHRRGHSWVVCIPWLLGFCGVRVLREYIVGLFLWVFPL
jgi:hypothetical protein